MTTREIEAQFVIEAPEYFRPVFDLYEQVACQAFGTALAAAFGHQGAVVTEVLVTFTQRFQLLEANGNMPRTPSHKEIQGVMMGTATTLSVVLRTGTVVHA